MGWETGDGRARAHEGQLQKCLGQPSHLTQSAKNETSFFEPSNLESGTIKLLSRISNEDVSGTFAE